MIHIFWVCVRSGVAYNSKTNQIDIRKIYIINNPKAKKSDAQKIRKISAMVQPMPSMIKIYQMGLV